MIINNKIQNKAIYLKFHLHRNNYKIVNNKQKMAQISLKQKIKEMKIVVKGLIKLVQGMSYNLKMRQRYKN